MPEFQLDLVNERVSRLESTCRRAMFACLTLACFATWLATTAFGPRAARRAFAINPSAEIEATAFVLVDDQGRRLGSLHASGGGPRLELYDASGTVRASLEHGAEGTALYLRDESGTTRVGVAQFAHGGGGFALHGEQAEGATVLYMSNGRGRLTFYGADGRVIEEVAPPTSE